jgi:hypothetical protein
VSTSSIPSATTLTPISGPRLMDERIAVAAQTSDDDAVELELADDQAAEVGQRRVARCEVVHRYDDAEFAQARDDGLRVRARQWLGLRASRIEPGTSASSATISNPRTTPAPR